MNGTSRATLVCMLSLGLSAGCSTLKLQDPARTGPFFASVAYQSAPSIPTEVRRVLVLPIASDVAMTEEQLIKLDEIVRTTLGQTSKFEVTPLTRSECARIAGKNAVRSTDALPHDFLGRLAASHAVDAVIFTDITSYSPYPPLRIGLRIKLARTVDNSLLWAFDTVFSATEERVVNSARRYWLDTAPANTPADYSNTVLENPSRFATYATSAAFSTLPRR